MSGVSLSDIVDRGGNNFDLLRLIAAASVIVSHAWVLGFASAGVEPLESVSVFTLGQHAVNVFFVLSGLLVASSLERSPDLVSFAAARVLRVFPGLAVCVLLTAFVVGPLASDLPLGDYLLSSETYAYIARTLTLSTGAATLPGVFGELPQAGMANLPLWTLKYEVIAYGLLGALALAGVWRRVPVLLAVVALLFVLDLAVLPAHGVDQHGTADHMVRFSTCFFLGVAAYRLRGRLRLCVPGAVLAALLLAAAHGSAFDEIANYVAVGYLALCFAALPLPTLRKLTARGDISYGLYIYGWPVTQLIVLAVPGIGPFGLAVAALALAAVPATLSWTLVERPAMALRRPVLRLLRAEPGPSVLQHRPLDAVQPGQQRIV